MALVPLTITIPRVDTIGDDADPDFIVSDDPDYYVRVSINNIPQDDSSEVSGETINPNWRYTLNVDSSLGTVPVHIELWDDDDDFARGDDDQLDISPVGGGRKAIDLTVDLTTGIWTSNDLLFGRFAEGNGDDHRARVTFFIDVNNPETDSDGDGLKDIWEILGIDADNNGVIDLTLPGANPYHKNLYVEVDSMTGHHNLDPNALNDVVNSFATAPNSLVNNPDTVDGISLSIQVSADADQNIPRATWSDFDNNNFKWPREFDRIKANRDPNVAGGFGTVAERDDPNATNILAAKRLAYRYCISGATTKQIGGQAELPGNDFMVTLGPPPAAGLVYPRESQAAVFMHELGHTLGLGHGGSPGPMNGTLTAGSDVVTGLSDTSQLVSDMLVSAPGLPPETRILKIDSPTQITLRFKANDGGRQTLFFSDATNHKPNYHSIMNYTWSYRFDTGTHPGQNDFNASWQLDYSRLAFPNLNEMSLDETVPTGIGGHTGHFVGIDPWGDPRNYSRFVPENGRVDWNFNGSTNDTAVSMDLNSSGSLGVLRGMEDWSHLVYGFRDTKDFADGVHLTSFTKELRWEVVLGELMFTEDKYEPNNTIATATVLGSEERITLRDLTIHDNIDVDYFKITAAHTGKLIVNALFDDSLGDLDFEIRDRSDNVVANSNSSGDGEQLVLPVVSQEAYFVKVFGAMGFTNAYSLEIENFPASVPIAIDLAADDDNGMSDTDNVTNQRLGTITVLADLFDFANMGIEILTPEGIHGGRAGAAVEVFVQGQSRGYARPLAGSNDTLFTFTFAPGDPAGGGDLFEGLNFVTAAVRIFDGKRPQANGRSQFSQPLLITLDTFASVTPLPPDLLTSSDSGMFDDDNVTNKMEPAFQNSVENGDMDPIFPRGQERNIKVRVKADGVVVGQAMTTTAGTWEITVEPLRDKVYQMTVELEDMAGNVSQMSEPLVVEIDTLSPNTPLLDLVETSDTGRHNDDNITKDTTPDLSLTTTDPNAASHLFAPNLKYRVFDRLEESSEVLAFDSFGVLGGLTSLTRVTTTLAVLANGVHNLKLEVEDRAGNISDDYLLDVLVDTVAPSGTGMLFPDSDTGMSASDRVTRDTTPWLTGKTEADALVRAAIDGNAAGTTVAVPFDGDDAFPPPPEFDGNYFLQTIHALADGEHTIRLYFQDLAGNESLATPAATIVILVDTAGPRITNVTRGQVSLNSMLSFDGVTSLFEPKPSPTGPDPLIHSIVFHFSDLVDRTASFANIVALFAAEASEEGQYQLKGDHHGNVSIRSANVTFVTTPGDGRPETARVELVLAAPLPDDRYTLWVSDTIMDPAGNSLDGESGARGPFDGNDVPNETPPIFPTGDSQPGGDFHGRFTIDSRPEIGTFTLGTAYLDINGNFAFDSQGDDRDQTNRDNVFAFSDRDDWLFAGNFAPKGATSATGYDKLAAYNGERRWLFDFDNDGVPDQEITSDVRGPGIPIAGNFDPSHPGDEIGLFDGSLWYLDTNGNNNLEFTDTVLHGWLRGAPIVGDFDGDGRDDLGTWENRRFTFDLANNGLTGAVERFIDMEEIVATSEWPVAADMNRDGIDDVGLYVNRREGVLPEQGGEWYFLISDGTPRVTGQVNTLDHRFTPVPFGSDLFAHFGNQDVRAIVGNFDPPVPRSLQVTPGDFDGSGVLDASDINLLFGQVRSKNADLRFDLTGDGVVGIADRDKLVRDILGTNYGDSNLDRTFNSSDLIVVLQSAEYEDGIRGNSTWEEGDWSGDGDFDTEDLILAFKSGGFVLTSIAQATVREPAVVSRGHEQPTTSSGEHELSAELAPTDRKRRRQVEALRVRDLLFTGNLDELKQEKDDCFVTY